MGDRLKSIGMHIARYGLAIVLLWVVLVQGADIPAYRDMAPVVGAVETATERTHRRGAVSALHQNPGRTSGLRDL